MEWCWQVSDSAKHKIYSGGYLFSALYRFFRFSYHGNGIYITPDVALPKDFIESFVALPLELQRDITNRIWNNGKGYRRVIVDNNSPVLPLSLRFLFSVYGRLKHITSEVVPPVDGTWQGTKLSRTEYKFVFGKPNLRATPFIPDFIDRNPLYFNPVDFRTICL
jgi:hypothetical protein